VPGGTSTVILSAERGCGDDTSGLLGAPVTAADRGCGDDTSGLLGAPVTAADRGCGDDTSGLEKTHNKNKQTKPPLHPHTEEDLVVDPYL
jgi:hypothetical protein